MPILLPNLLTALNLLGGVYSIYLSLKGHLVLAGGMIIFCALLDGLDGAIARFLNQESTFGKFFDSIADFLSFGLAPLFFLMARKTSFKFIDIFVISVYLVACIFRLIRFHLENHPTAQQNKFFTGLPITASAVIFVIVTFTMNKISPNDAMNYTLLGILSILMASRIPIDKQVFCLKKN